MVSADLRRQEESPIIAIQEVSKYFVMHREIQRSIQDIFIHSFRRFSRMGHKVLPENRSDVFWPLRQVSFDVYPGESLGLIGGNGAGKSTLLKLIAGILLPTSGQILVRGRISSLLELGAGFHHELTGRENIYLNASIYGMNRRMVNERIDQIIDFAELGNFIDTPVKFYSSGMYVRLGFSVAIHADPDILLVDEVLAVGDHIFQQKCLERIYDLRDNGTTIVLVSHDASEIANLCNKILWLEDGHIRMQGDAKKVVDAYTSEANVKYYTQCQQAKDEADALAKEAAPDPDDSDEQAEQPETFQRWGTRQAEITGIELLDHKHAPATYFETGRFFCLRIHYVAHEPVANPTFGLAFYRRDGAHINGPNSFREGYEIEQIHGTGHVDYVIDALPLLQGTYELTVAIYNQESTVAHDHHHHAYQFDVRAAGSWVEEGVVHIPAQWTHVESKN